MKRLLALAILGMLTVTSPLIAQTFVALPAVDDTVKAFAAHGNILYIAGSFTTVGGMTRHGLAAIDLTDGSVTSWDPDCTNGGAGAFLDDVTVSADGSTVYFCGNFDKVGATARNYLAAVSSAGVLQPLSATFNDQVAAVRELNGTLYVIGNFKTVNGTDRIGFAGLDSTGTLTAFDPGLGTFTTASFRAAVFSSDGTKMYVSIGNTGLDFKDVDGNTAPRRGFVALRLSDGRATSFAIAPKEIPFDAGTFTVATHGSTLYVGGSFDHFGTDDVERLAGFKNEIFDSTFSRTTGTGPSGAVRSIASDGTAVYVGGAFTSFGATARTGLAAVDPKTGELISSWDPQLSVKLSGTGAVIFQHEGKVFIGGPDLTAGTTLLGQGIEHYGALTAIPAPVVTPTPAPTPMPAAPTVKISGPKSVKTTKAKLALKGSAAGAVSSVLVQVGKSAAKPATGTTAWKFKAALKPGKNVITVLATGPGGSSSPAKITVTRK